MTTKYQTDIGEVITASNANELVSTMRNTAFMPSESNKAFMQEIAKRIFNTGGCTVREDNEENFVADLLAIGFLKKKD